MLSGPLSNVTLGSETVPCGGALWGAGHMVPEN